MSTSLVTTAGEVSATPDIRWLFRSLNRFGRTLVGAGVARDGLEWDDVVGAARRMEPALRVDDAAAHPLRLMLADYAAGPPLSVIGRRVVCRILARTLVNRHRVEAMRRATPDLEASRPRRPLIVVGLPRTGTTLLFNLLASAPGARPLQIWESMEPVGPERGAGALTDPRRRAALGMFGLLRVAVPGITGIHEFSWNGPEECTGLLFNTLRTPVFRGDLPAYREWLFGCGPEEMDAAYRFHADQLAICERQRPAPAGGHWVLKSPSHTFALDSLLRALPDATLVWTHRDPAVAVASWSSLTAVFDRITYERLDRAGVGARTLQIGEEMLRRAVAVAERESQRIVHVAYRDLVADPLGTVARIHERAGLELGEDATRCVRAELRQRTRSRHAAHAYRLEDFGLDAGAVHAATRGYRERFTAELASA